jgi:DNA-binding transcriptional regulator YiaG
MNQEELRKQVKIVKALNDDIYYKDFAMYLNINENSFYNWLNGYYSLSKKNIKLLQDIIIDLI